ncbi:hypothetical protein Mtc_0223 [Methanocella conradii HZ254]|uniref:Uncharacterized protein n=1 Tax=Methanocella conradii (strain DSM 24694 / JCM 17849 / CGMCC 1.5162 / HZ254) TaxID=1041930 RepID=H8I8E1_METCZ|nr:hypothetical protein [Methanocella conradii]AFC98994.1 hypothetical protein Mtc_0223 [Methanocella conradii HZ254]MDI6896761.1 hypothetical protein [Methanocella conradii]
MIKWIIAACLIMAMLAVAGCCCCCGYDHYSYATVKCEEQSCPGGQCETPYDCLNVPCDACAAQK